MIDADTSNSSHRENLIEHLFIGEVLRQLWCLGVYDATVLRSEIDAAGYDLVIEVGSIVRHIQLKSSSHSAKTSRQKINIALENKPSGCVVWIRFDPNSMKLGPFHWFGGKPGSPMKKISEDVKSYPIAKHSKANSEGVKAQRFNLRLINKGKFDKTLNTVEELILELFGRVSSEK